MLSKRLSKMALQSAVIGSRLVQQWHLMHQVMPVAASSMRCIAMPRPPSTGGHKALSTTSSAPEFWALAFDPLGNPLYQSSRFPHVASCLRCGHGTLETMPLGTGHPDDRPRELQPVDTRTPALDPILNPPKNGSPQMEPGSPRPHGSHHLGEDGTRSRGDAARGHATSHSEDPLSRPSSVPLSRPTLSAPSELPSGAFSVQASA